MIPKMIKITLVATALVLSNSQSAAAQDGPGPALWQVSDEDTTVYLFGTIHILPADIEWLTGNVRTAFDASSEFVTEIDMTRVQSFESQMIAAGTLPVGETLRSLMTPGDKAEFEAMISMLGLPIENLDRLDPWLVAQILNNVILIQNGYDPVSGVDNVLTAMASSKHKDTLETAEWQLELFDKTPIDLQLGNLNNVIGWAPTIREWTDSMVDLWVVGNTSGLAELISATFPDPAYRDRLLTNRNSNWADWIDSRLKDPGIVFVAVGIAHLVGPGSVQEQLLTRGIQTDRIR